MFPHGKMFVISSNEMITIFKGGSKYHSTKVVFIKKKAQDLTPELIQFAFHSNSLSKDNLWKFPIVIYLIKNYININHMFLALIENKKLLGTFHIIFSYIQNKA